MDKSFYLLVAIGALAAIGLLFYLAIEMLKIKKVLKEIQEKLNQLMAEQEILSNRFDGIERKLNGIENRLEAFERDIKDIKHDLGQVTNLLKEPIDIKDLLND